MEEIAISCRYRSFADHARSGMRRGSNTSFSSGYQSSASSSIPTTKGETIRLRRELAAVRKQLIQMEDTISQHVEITERIMQVSKSEKDILKSQLEEAQETIEELRNEVEIARRSEFSSQNGNPQMENNTINSVHQQSSISTRFAVNDVINQKFATIKQGVKRFLSLLHPTIRNRRVMLFVIGTVSILCSFLYAVSCVE